MALPIELSRSLRALAQQQGATPFMVLLAAFQTFLHRYSGQDDISVGTPRYRPLREGDSGVLDRAAELHPARSSSRACSRRRAVAVSSIPSICSRLFTVPFASTIPRSSSTTA